MASYLATLGQLAGRLGTQLSLQEQAQDVTQQVADVSSQVTSYQAAIAQLRALLSHAGSVGDLLSVQNQINAEETAFEAMQAEQRALSHETSYATVSLTIIGPKAARWCTGKAIAHPGGRPRRRLGALRVTVSWTWPSSVRSRRSRPSRPWQASVYRARRWALRRKPAAGPAPES